MTFQNKYGLVDRLLHRLAFATPQMQIDFAESEDRRFAAHHPDAKSEKPVFIMALPRAGTTILLNVLAGLGSFVTHTYRDMPFLLMPIAWSAISKPFARSEIPRERAHGDGLMVSVDSPEAFEEILWKAFWPSQYKDDRISVWPANGGDEFRDFFRRHMAKLAIAKCGNDAPLPRYASKNNLNIARIGWLRNQFPDATILVLFREPTEHAASLLRQHLNFLDLHHTDAFAREYMAGIGHFDFGANLKPIDFSGWLDQTPYPPTALEFWLSYWTATYRYCLEHNSAHAVFVDYDALRRTPRTTLEWLSREIGVSCDTLTASTALIETRPPHCPKLGSLDPALLADARAVHAALLEGVAANV